MSIFHRKHKQFHALIGTYEENAFGVQYPIKYTCTVCQREFYDLASASWKYSKEWCPGKRCYVEFTFSEIPHCLMSEKQIRDSGRKLRKHQEPLAYKHYELITTLSGPLPVEYIPLYDVRECQCLDDAVSLPALE